MMLPSGDDEINYILGGGYGRAGYATGYSGGASVLVGGGNGYAEPGSSYNTVVGKQFAVAFNDRSFNTYSSYPRSERFRYAN